MKTSLALALSLAALLSGCGSPAPTVSPTPASPAPQSPNAALLTAADAIAAGCAGALIAASPALTPWLTSQCPNAVETIVGLMDSGGTVAQVKAAITGLQNSAASIPAGSLTAQDQKTIAAVLASANLFLSLYQQQTQVAK